MLHSVLCNSMSFLSQRSCDIRGGKQGLLKHEAATLRGILCQIFWLWNLMTWRVIHIRREKRQQFFLLCTEVGAAVRVDGPNSLCGNRKGIPSVQSLSYPQQQTALHSVLVWYWHGQVCHRWIQNLIKILLYNLLNCLVSHWATQHWEEVSQMVSKIFPLLTYFLSSAET